VKQVQVVPNKVKPARVIDEFDEFDFDEGPKKGKQAPVSTTVLPHNNRVEDDFDEFLNLGNKKPPMAPKQNSAQPPPRRADFISQSPAA